MGASIVSPVGSVGRVSITLSNRLPARPDIRFSGEQDMARRAATEARWAKEEEARQAESRRGYEASLRR
jgi:hypothetical protein